jgi:hypothetical protein
MDRDVCTLPEPTVTGAPREDRGRAAAALISVCLGFFVIQLDAWNTAVNVYWEVDEGGGEDEHTGTAARRSKVHCCG